MKMNFSKSAGRRRGKSWAFLLGLVLPVVAARAAEPFYINNGTITTPPQVDATNFVNNGTWDIISTPLPYETQSTLNYTNEGSMTSQVGWEFDYGPLPAGGRGLSASFFNDSPGTIQAVDGDIFNPPENPNATLASYLLVSATNIVNWGTLGAGPSGQIMLIGTNDVDLSYSQVEIASATASSSGSLPFLTSPTNVTPAEGFIYQGWGETNMNIVTSNLWNGSTFTVPPTMMMGSCQSIELFGSFGAYNNFTFYTNHQGGFLITSNSSLQPINSGVATNYANEVVFILPPNQASFTGDVRFTPSLASTNIFDTVTVQLTETRTNPVTLQLETGSFYLVDVLNTATNTGLFIAPPSPIAICSEPTFQPESYVVARSDVPLPSVYFPYYNLGNGEAFGNGLPGVKGLPPANFLFDPSWSNNIISSRFAALITYIDHITAPPLAGVSIESGGGRVQIYAGNLNLGLTRMSGESWVDIQAKNLVDSVGAVVDCPNLSFDLGSTNGTLIFTNLALSSVNRFQGNVIAWSATWSNLTTVVVPTWIPDPVSPTNPPVQSFLTNSAQENLYVMVVDASQLTSSIPVMVLDLHLHATNNVPTNGVGGNIVIGDSVTVTNSFFMDGQGLTIQQNVALANGVQNWVWTNAPTLLYFTNNGTLTIPNNANFGNDGPTNYLAFVNHGSISNSTQTINSDYFENDGALTNSQGCYVTASAGEFQNGRINSGGGIQFFGNNLKFNQSSLQASGAALDFTLANSLADAGPGSSNTFTCDYGFNLYIKPPTGDLLGTIMRTVTPNIPSRRIRHSWAGTNYGPSNAGYSNNVALGQLVLASQGSLVTDPAVFFFSGATGGGVTNGLYVDLLDLTALGNNWTNIQQNLLQIDPSLVIYYAAAKVGFTPPPAANGLPPQEPEEFLNGQFGGHLRWVQTFAGPNSSVAVVINGQSYEVNKALRFATTIDSNSNGIPNYADANPFSTPPSGSIPLLLLKVSLAPPGGQVSSKTGPTNQLSSSVVALSWLAVSNTVYGLQFTTNLAAMNWQPLLTYTNNAPTNQTVSVFDTNAPANASQRFYRLYGP